MRELTGEGLQKTVRKKKESTCWKSWRPRPGCWSFICSSKQAGLYRCPFVAFEHLCPWIFALASLISTSSLILSQAVKITTVNNTKSFMIYSQYLLVLVRTTLALCIRELWLQYFCITKRSKPQGVFCLQDCSLLQLLGQLHLAPASAQFPSNPSVSL